MTLDIQQIFPTLQGEGPYAGMPAVFIRLGGCNLACGFCDTEFESYRAMALADILATVQAHAGGTHRLAVITGGEPLRQPIERLCEGLLTLGMQVQIETNGTLWRDLPAGVEVICSPKHSGGGYVPLRGDLLARVNAFKFIVSAGDAHYRDVGDVGQGRVPVYVQPMDECDAAKNAANLALALRLAQTRGYRLSLQLHKLLGIE